MSCDTDITQAAIVIRDQSGTPFYLFSEKMLHEDLNAIQEAVHAWLPRSSVAYSVKTNPLPQVVQFYVDAGLALEVSAAQELENVVPMSAKSVLFDGIAKPPWSVEKAIAIGATVVIDGWEQLRLVTGMARHRSGVVRVGIRLSTSSITGEVDRFGFTTRGCDIGKVSDQIQSAGNVEVELLQIHFGTNQKNPELYRNGAAFLARVAEAFGENGIEIKLLDVGGGFPNAAAGVPFELYGECIAEGLRASGRSASAPMIVESGRGLVERAGHLAASVVDIRRETHGKPHVVLDGGTNLAMGQHLVGPRSFIVGKAGGKSRATYEIAGPLCIQDDVFSNDVTLPELVIGDLVLIENVGAYDMSTAYLFGASLPPVFCLRVSGELERWR